MDRLVALWERHHATGILPPAWDGIHSCWFELKSQYSHVSNMFTIERICNSHVTVLYEMVMPENFNRRRKSVTAEGIKAAVDLATAKKFYNVEFMYNVQVKHQWNGVFITNARYELINGIWSAGSIYHVADHKWLVPHYHY